MFFKDSSNNRYYLGRQFTFNSIQYSAAAATEAQFTTLGLTKVTLDAKPDSRFYNFTGPDINGAYTSTAKDLATLKENFVAETKTTARQLLAQTVHYILDNLEDNTISVPADVTTYRAQVRTANTTRCNEINACADVAALQTLINSTITAFPGLPTGVDAY
jgi:hypothetical protein